MKKIIITVAAAAALITPASCKRDSMPEPVSGDGQSTVMIMASPAYQTKATGVKDDATDTKKVSSIEVFAFDKDGVLRSYESSTTSSSVTMTLNTGEEYTFWAVANNYGSSAWKYPAIGSITSAGELGNIMTDLKDNAKDNLLMFSQSAVTKTVTSSTESLSIEVTRLVSKVQVKKITVDFGSNEALKSKSLKIDSIYVINAAKNESLLLAPATEVTYYNSGKYVSGSADALLCDKLSTAHELSSSAGAVTPYTTEHTFFTYGNAGQGTSSTKLVISCSWGGERTYYPILIAGSDDKLSPNCAYIVNQLTIKGLGSDDPNIIPERQSFTASITIKDWGTGFSKDIEL